jgi:hypothetical protein
MFKFEKEYKIKLGDIDYKKNILASFGFEIINLLKECPIKIYSVDTLEVEKEDDKTKEKFDVMVVTANITKLHHKDKKGKCKKINIPATKSKLKINKIDLKNSKKKVKNG